MVDKFSGHFVDSSKFQNVELLFLPPNTTSVLQPFDQGIIRSFKSKYKSRVLNDYYFNFEQNIPFKPIDIRTAICHASDAWNEVTTSTIQNCWIKSTLVKKEDFINNDSNAIIDDSSNNIYGKEMVNEHIKNNELCQKMYGVED